MRRDSLRPTDILEPGDELHCSQREAFKLGAEVEVSGLECAAPGYYAAEHRQRTADALKGDKQAPVPPTVWTGTVLSHDDKHGAGHCWVKLTGPVAAERDEDESDDIDTDETAEADERAERREP